MAGDGAKFPQQLIFENVSPATRLLEKRRQMSTPFTRFSSHVAFALRQNCCVVYELYLYIGFCLNEKSRRRRETWRETKARLSFQYFLGMVLAGVVQRCARSRSFPSILEVLTTQCYTEFQQQKLWAVRNIRIRYEVNEALEAQKARFAKDEEQFKKREESLRTKDLHLQHQLIRFNKSILVGH